MIKCVDNFAFVEKIADDGILTAIASTGSIDRDGERILPTAFEGSITSYMKNPVIMANHIHRSFEGTPTIIGSAQKVWIEKKKLMFDMKFASTGLAQEWKSLYDEGHARAFSVGFMPISGKEVEKVYTHTEVELIEISAVSVPSNRDALMRGISDEELAEIAEILKHKDHKTDLETKLHKYELRYLQEIISSKYRQPSI